MCWRMTGGQANREIDDEGKVIISTLAMDGPDNLCDTRSGGRPARQPIEHELTVSDVTWFYVSESIDTTHPRQFRSLTFQEIFG